MTLVISDVMAGALAFSCAVWGIVKMFQILNDTDKALLKAALEVIAEAKESETNKESGKEQA